MGADFNPLVTKDLLDNHYLIYFHPLTSETGAGLNASVVSTKLYVHRWGEPGKYLIPQWRNRALVSFFRGQCVKLQKHKGDITNCLIIIVMKDRTVAPGHCRKQYVSAHSTTGKQDEREKYRLMWSRWERPGNKEGKKEWDIQHHSTRSSSVDQEAHECLNLTTCWISIPTI